MNKRIPIILDGDPGHDDAIAWVLAGANKDFDILAITTVCGNQTIEKTTYNARRIMSLIDLDVPVGMGRPNPIFSEPIIAPTVHGKTGLDGPDLPEPKFPLSELSSVELIADKLEKSEEKVIIVPTGPLTNIASFLLSYPHLKEKIKYISLMGGGIQYGNWTTAAEFNILVDPEAAKIVFESGVPIYMAGLDVTEKALIYPEDFETIRAARNPVASVVADWLEFFYGFHRERGYEGAPVHDAVAVAVITNPEIMKIEEYYVEVETKGEFCRGATIADRYGVTGKKPNAKVIVGIDREKFVELIVEACKTYGEDV